MENKPLKVEVEVSNRSAIRRMQRIISTLEQTVDILDKYKYIKIEVTVREKRKKWWQIWK